MGASLHVSRRLVLRYKGIKMTVLFVIKPKFQGFLVKITPRALKFIEIQTYNMLSGTLK